jgi:hypothetical protein
MAKYKKSTAASSVSDKPQDRPLIVQPSPIPTEMVVRYAKSNLHRVIHVDGVFGGPSVGGLIHIAIYSERVPVPTEQTYDISSNGIISEFPKSQKGGDGVLREIEASLMLSVPLADNLIPWLRKAIDNAKANMEAMQKAQAAGVK